MIFGVLSIVDNNPSGWYPFSEWISDLLHAKGEQQYYCYN